MKDILNGIFEKIKNDVNNPRSAKILDTIKNNLKFGSEIKEREVKEEKKVISEFYGKDSELNIDGFSIKNAFMYYCNNSSMGIAISPVKNNKQAFRNYYYDTGISKNFNEFDNDERQHFLEWLSFFKYNDKNQVNVSSFLCLNFRNMQQRAIVDGKDLKDILFESIKFLLYYADNSFYYFKDNMIYLIIYLIFTINEFSKEEKEKLYSFITENRNRFSLINDYFDSLFLKITEISVEEFIKRKFEIDKGNDVFLERIFEYVRDVDYCKVNSKFYKFKSIYFRKTFKKVPIMLIVLKILIKQNSVNLEENFSIGFSRVVRTYSNYYLNYDDEKEYSFNLIECKVGLILRKLIFQASQIIEKYEEDKQEFLRNKKTSSSLTDNEKFSLLPLPVQNYFNAYILGKKTKKENKQNVNDIKIEFGIDFNKLSSIKNDTEDIHNVLTDIFSEEDDNEEEQYIIKEDKNNDELDEKYLDFIAFVKQKEEWSESELKAYCKEHKMMLNNAIDVVNEYYDEKYGDYLIEEEDENFFINNF